MSCICIQRALEIDPDYVEVYFNLGNLLSDEGNYTEALKKWETIISTWLNDVLLYTFPGQF